LGVNEFFQGLAFGLYVVEREFHPKLGNIQSKKMQLSNRVTSAKNTPHNSDYVDCSAFPGNGIAAKIDGLPLGESVEPH
jgi:hypothetical protein